MEVENKEDEKEKYHEDNSISDLKDVVDLDNIVDNLVVIGAEDDKSKSSNGVLDNTSRKDMEWTAEEDATILRKAENQIYSYAAITAEFLEGHSAGSIVWVHFLKNHNTAHKSSL